MANPSGDKGTARESWWKQQGVARGFRAQRYENNATCRDVDFTLADGTVVAHEVKDRQNLNGHKVLKATQAAWPGHLVALLWHRVSKPSGAKRSHPDGPTSVLVPADTWLDVLQIVEAAGVAVDAHPSQLPARLHEAVERLRANYPEARP